MGRELPEKEIIYTGIPAPGSSAPMAPDDFYGPGFPETPAVPGAGAPVVVHILSALFEATCEEHWEGADATVLGDPFEVAAGAVRDSFDLRAVPGLRQTHAAYLETLPQAVVDSMAAMSAGQLSSVGKFTAAQAGFLADELASRQASADNAAMLSAIAGLECYWLNAEQVSECDPVSATGYPNAPSVIPAGAVSSTTGQADADAVAKGMADSALECAYGNNAIVRTCLDKLGAEGYYEGEDATTTITVPANEFSAATQQEADDLAEAFARSQLDCFYVNEEVVADCGGDHESILASLGTGEGGLFHEVEITAASPRGESGQLIVVRAGAIASAFSAEDATEQARMLASSLLDCYWVNAYTVAECPRYRHPEGGQPELLVYDPVLDDPPLAGEGPLVWALETPGRRRAEVAKGTYVSYTDQDDADDRAGLHAQSLLDCWYCSPGVEPTCVPEGVEAGYNPLDLDPALPPFTAWSRDATMGVVPCLLQGQDYPALVGLADGLALQRAREIRDGTNDCTYGNDLLLFSCIQQVDENDEVVVHGKFKLDGTLANGSGGHPVPDGTVADYLSANCYPPINPLDTLHPYGQIAVAADTFILARTDLAEPETDDPKEEANRQARDFGLSLLYCFFENDDREAICTDLPRFSGLVSDDQAQNGTPVYDGNGNILYYLVHLGEDPDPPTPGDPVEIPSEWWHKASNMGLGGTRAAVSIAAGVVRSEFSLADMEAQLAQYLDGLLFCAFTNESREPVCTNLPAPGGGKEWVDPPLPVVIQEGTIISYLSRADANAEAQRWADSMGCIPEDFMGGFDPDDIEFYNDATTGKLRSKEGEGGGTLVGGVPLAACNPTTEMGIYVKENISKPEWKCLGSGVLYVGETAGGTSPFLQVASFAAAKEGMVPVVAANGKSIAMQYPKWITIPETS
jgi:hypothetical protein